MKKALFGKSLLAVTLCTLFSTAHAAGNTKYQAFGNSDSETEHSYYLGGSIGSSVADGFCLTDGNCEDKSTSWKAYGGYQLTELLTLEGGYLNLGELGRQPDDTTESPTKISGFTGSLMASLPVQDKMHVFGKAGFFKQKTNNTNTSYTDDLKPAYGVGADYEVGEGIAIRGEWEKFDNISSENNDESADIQILSVGMTFSSL